MVETEGTGVFNGGLSVNGGIPRLSVGVRGYSRRRRVTDRG